MEERRESFVEKNIGGIFVGVSIIAITGAISLVYQLQVQSELTRQQFFFIEQKLNDIKESDRDFRKRFINYEDKIREIETRVDRAINNR